MDHIKDILKDRIHLHGIAKPVSTAQVLQYCQKILPSILGEDVFSGVTLLHVKRGIILCKVKQPAIGQELKMRERVIVQKISAEFPSEHITSIRIIQ